MSHGALKLLATPLIARQVDYGGALLLSLSLTSMLVAVTRAGKGVPCLERGNLELIVFAGVT